MLLEILKKLFILSSLLVKIFRKRTPLERIGALFWTLIVVPYNVVGTIKPLKKKRNKEKKRLIMNLIALKSNVYS